MHDPLHGLLVTHEYSMIKLSVGSRSACSVFEVQIVTATHAVGRDAHRLLAAYSARGLRTVQ